MKKTFLLFVAATALLVACTKNNTTNNITTPLPAFTVNGIHDISLVNGNFSGYDMPVTIQYSDSSQEVVALSLSSLPAGIAMDTTWTTSGIPSYTTDLVFYDTTANGATPGSYPMTLTATGVTTGIKTYPFNLKVHAQAPCTTNIVGKYINCNACNGTFYRDSVTADPTVVNKIWFANFNNSGNKVYGLYNCSTSAITIPSQTVGGITYAGNGEGFGSSTTSHSINLDFTTNTNTCDINMN